MENGVVGELQSIEVAETRPLSFGRLRVHDVLLKKVYDREAPIRDVGCR